MANRYYETPPMTWDDTVGLISSEYTEDELGQPVAEETKEEINCCRLPVSRAEFYTAGQNGIEVSELITVHPYEYNGQNIVEFNGKRLRVVRVYQRNMEELELTCTEKLGDRNGTDN